MGEWRPIETAPKDGTTVLLYGNSVHGKPQMMTARWRPYRDRGGWWVGFNGGFPTHWQPRPDPPKESDHG